MSKLSEFLSAHFVDLKLSQKDVATAFHNEHEHRSGGRDPLKFDTVVSKLSKLMNGALEGERFFLEKSERLSAFAVATGLEKERLLAARATRTIVFDPRLAADAKQYFRDRAAAADARHCCCEVDPADNAAELYSKLKAKAGENPGCIVVLADPTFEPYLTADKLQVSTVEKNPLGWVLVGAPDLVSLPPPPGPAMCDDDGHPMIPHEEYEALVRQSVAINKDPFRSRSLPLRISDVTAKRFAHAEEVGTKHTFRLDVIGPWLVKQAGLKTVRWDGVPPDAFHYQTRVAPDDLARHCFASLLGDPAETMVWTHGGRVFAIGPDAEWVANVVDPHTVERPASFARWKTALGTWNPYATFGAAESTDRKRSESWYDLSREVRSECGVEIDHVTHRWREYADPERDLPATWRVCLNAASERVRALEAVRALLERDFELAFANLCFIFRLELLLGGSIIPLARGSRDLAHVVANLGAGHMTRVRVIGYPDEQPTPIRLTTSESWTAHLDGGDVHIIIQRLSDDLMLEASPLPAARRRAREEEDARRRADDDD